jgi:murein DD-endopeptidase MepM/ murein hydrolase activator NlpD
MRSIPKRISLPLVALIAVFLLIASVGGNASVSYQGVPANAGDANTTDVPLVDEKIVEYEIQPGDTAMAVLSAQGLEAEESFALISSAKDVFDFAQMQAGRIMTFRFVNEALAAIEYPLSSEEIVVVEKTSDAYRATTTPIEYEIEEVVARGYITDSLFLSGVEAGMDDNVIMELADIFSSDIDFVTDIREGDSFAVVYEKRRRDGEDAGSGHILGASFTNEGTTYSAFRYEDAYYDSSGLSKARQFLKSPLSYGRISSGFSYKRTNPVTKQVTPHRAIDYAAPQGTPVIATGKGTVITAGSKGDLGITVELQHGIYKTQYAHLSRIAKDVKRNAEVEQGDVVGYVGSTGISTGPHLQYALFENGNPINPQTAEFSSGDPIAESSRSDFESVRDVISKRLGM